jgi:hypothetical protein
VARKVPNALTVQYDRVMYLLQDTEVNRRLIPISGANRAM